jgi:nucleoside-specific outer membrane channel protein Tsx
MEGLARGRTIAKYVLLVLLGPLTVPAAFAQGGSGFSVSNVQALYGWNFSEPGIDEDVPKNTFTFENTAAGRWWSSYLFVDVLRSWSDADANAKEVYGEWFPTVGLLKVFKGGASAGLLRDVGVTVGLNSGVRSTGPSPFVVLPGATADLGVTAFRFLSVGVYAYIDRGRFEGQPTGCRGTTYQVTPAWSLPMRVGGATLSFDGFVDFIGSHAECEAQVVSQPQLKLDLSALWNKPGQLAVGVEWDYWHNKYGIADLQDSVFLPVFVWTL